MTFGEATTILRNDILAELSTDFYENEDLEQFIKDAARELAQAHQFPREVATAAVALAATTFTPAAESATVALNEVAIDGFELKLAPLSTVLQYKVAAIGNPRYYAYDPRRGGVVDFAPPALRAGTVTYERVIEYDTSLLGPSDEIWDGLFASWHMLVLHRAGAKAFEASLETERASYHLQRMMAMQQEFSAYLERTPVSQLALSAGAGAAQ